MLEEKKYWQFYWQLLWSLRFLRGKIVCILSLFLFNLIFFQNFSANKCSLVIASNFFLFRWKILFCKIFLKYLKVFRKSIWKTQKKTSETSVLYTLLKTWKFDKNWGKSIQAVYGYSCKTNWMFILFNNSFRLFKTTIGVLSLNNWASNSNLLSEIIV